MARESVSAQTKEGAAVAFEFDFGDSFDEAAGKFNADIVWAYAKRALIIAAQSHARGLLRGGKSVDDIQTAMDAWKPGTPRVSRSPQEKLQAEWAKMSPEDRQAFLRDLQGEAAPAPARRRSA